ncbi:DUF4160 domain-containing protein [Luteibacter yeojuensis]|uniref:DUF4160 domain-containing protein n=1 Tax=Luteibacter yeojuensis TaxID=345309 RepID=UPI0018DCFD0E|nr:DUF4160 domain-containing protein [Luteibacter yeojuensis]
MPALARFDDCVIYMYAADHPPPHFHIRMKDGREAMVRIGGLAPMLGEVAAQELGEPLAWAHRHAAFLKFKWRELNT